MQTPKIDERTYEEIVRGIEDKAKELTKWQPKSPDAGAALIRIFSRFMTLVVDRLNQVPEKNYLVFLNLIGADLLPPQPARVPLTFQLAANSPLDALIRSQEQRNQYQVPAGTQVAAPPAEGEDSEVVFETEENLVVTRAQLKAVLVWDKTNDKYSDHSQKAMGNDDGAFPIFTGAQTIEHSLYVAHEFFSLPEPKTISLTFELTEVSKWGDLSIVWSYWDGSAWRNLETDPDPDSSSSDSQRKVKFKNLPAVDRCIINGQEASWLRAQLDLNNEANLTPENITIRSIRIQVSSKLIPKLGFSNSLALDLPKEFYPFGEEPRHNAIFYLSCEEVITQGGAKAGDTITIKVELKDAGAAGGSSIPPRTDEAATAGKPLRIEWEFWDGETWHLLGKSSDEKVSVNSDEYNFQDTTRAFTNAENGEISFNLPVQITPSMVNGEQSYWLRARLAEGHYGVGSDYREKQITVSDQKISVYEWIRPNFKPPIVASLSFSVSEDSEIVFSCCHSYNGFTYVKHTSDNAPGFAPFTPADAPTALYLGFDLPFSNQAVTLYAQVEPPKPEDVSAASLKEKLKNAQPRVVWEYFWKDLNGSDKWSPLGAVDETLSFSRRGIIRFIGPPDMACSHHFGRNLYWLRARWEAGEFAVPPRLRRLLLNTTWASQATTIRDETLGSSSGNPGQTFQLAQVPVLSDICLEVREPELPADATTPIPNGDEFWVRWHTVPDFNGSGPQDRHYTIDYLTGIVRFGDGRNGLIPPPGRNNIRAASYRSGGGPSGNRPQESVIQLKSSVPYIDSVTNYEAASGGAAQQSLAHVKRYAPRQLRHQGRAVTVEDFEDLAFAASAEVARAKAVSPISNNEDAGNVSLIIVPRSDSPQPVPSVGLLEQVRAYLLARCPATLDPDSLRVTGPDWEEVTVNGTVVVTSLAMADVICDRVKSALERFLHPLTGGFQDKGWPFGRLPHTSDLYVLIESAEGVDHVSALKVTPDPDEADKAGLSETFLIYSGKHTIEVKGG